MDNRMNTRSRKRFISLVTISLVISSLVSLTEASSQAGILDTIGDELNNCVSGGCDPTPAIPGSAEVAEKLWGTAGRAAYPAAAKIMRERNTQTAKGLSAAHKRLLKRRYGDIVESVRVVYNARMMEKWCALGKCVQIGGTESAAQTFGTTVYVKGPERPIDINQFLLLAHELKHVQQQKGRLDTFGYDYFKAYKQAGQNYANNRMEQEAEAEVNWFAQRVICPSTGCQWR
jgi:Domain of unknown function (DUF4157)